MIDSTRFMEWQWMCSSIGVLCYGVRNGVWLAERRSGAGAMGVGRGVWWARSCGYRSEWYW